MKQLLQNLKSGEIILHPIPLPNYGPNDILIQTTHSLISPGTERMLLNFGQSSYIQKAKQQPEKVKQVISKIKTDGLIPTIQAVNAKLSTPLPLGYSNVGTVLEVGANVSTIKKGDTVISNGSHASVVSINQNLVAKVPENIPNNQAVFTIIASIALQGIRITNPTLGETIVVIGLGLLGQITLDLLKINGCQAIGFDIDESKVKLAKSRGFKAFNSLNTNGNNKVRSLTNQIGADAVIITASTKGNEPTEQAVDFCRKKGRIIAVGAFKMDIPREFFYKKELSFHISMSYGPGRYDKNYEEKGQDYPIGYVRWTEKRNFEATLKLLSNKQLDFNYLITKKVEFSSLETTYSEILNDTNCLGALINYDVLDPAEKTIKINNFSIKSPAIQTQKPFVGMIGAGNFSTITLLPILKKQNISLVGISSFKGLSGTLAAKKFNFSYSTTDYQKLIADDSINTIIISTQHTSHSLLVCEALNASKHIFVEKPLAVDKNQLGKIMKTYNQLEIKPVLMVGFNRRFSPLSSKLLNLIQNKTSPICINIQINAGFIPNDHWVHETKQGGRFIGEGCHFIDLIHYFTGSKIISIQSIGMGKEKSPHQNDTISTQFECEDGSIASIQYFSNGNKKYPKEKITIYSEGDIFEIINWKEIRKNSAKYYSSFFQEKGHKEELNCFFDGICSKKSAIPFESLMHTTLVSLKHIDALETGNKISLL